MPGGTALTPRMARIDCLVHAMVWISIPSLIIAVITTFYASEFHHALVGDSRKFIRAVDHANMICATPGDYYDAFNPPDLNDTTPNPCDAWNAWKYNGTEIWNNVTLPRYDVYLQRENCGRTLLVDKQYLLIYQWFMEMLISPWIAIGFLADVEEVKASLIIARIAIIILIMIGHIIMMNFFLVSDRWDQVHDCTVIDALCTDNVVDVASVLKISVQDAYNLFKDPEIQLYDKIPCDFNDYSDYLQQTTSQNMLNLYYSDITFYCLFGICIIVHLATQLVCTIKIQINNRQGTTSNNTDRLPLAIAA
jgi:hypothetical protein